VNLFFETLKKNFDLILNISALLIILFVITITGLIAYDFITSRDNSSQLISIDLKKIQPTQLDSTLVVLNKSELDSLIKYFKQYDEQLDNMSVIRQDILRLKDEESYYSKLYISIVAIILVIAGFFGFKSIYEIKSSIRESAEFTATKVANEVAKDLLTDEYIARKFDEAYMRAKKIYEEQISGFEERLDDIEDSIDKLENPDKYGRK
jgi:transcription termination factor NusB